MLIDWRASRLLDRCPGNEMANAFSDLCSHQWTSYQCVSYLTFGNSCLLTWRGHYTPSYVPGDRPRLFSRWTGGSIQPVMDILLAFWSFSRFKKLLSRCIKIIDYAPIVTVKSSILRSFWLALSTSYLFIVLLLYVLSDWSVFTMYYFSFFKTEHLEIVGEPGA